MIKGASTDALDALYNDAHSWLLRSISEGQVRQTHAIMHRIVEEWSRQREDAYRTKQNDREEVVWRYQARRDRRSQYIATASAIMAGISAVAAWTAYLLNRSSQQTTQQQQLIAETKINDLMREIRSVRSEVEKLKAPRPSAPQLPGSVGAFPADNAAPHVEPKPTPPAPPP